MLLGVALGAAFLAAARAVSGDFLTVTALSIGAPFVVALASSALLVSGMVTGITAGLVIGRTMLERAGAGPRQKGAAFWQAFLSGSPTPTTAVAISAGVLLLLTFVRIERRTAAPPAPPRTFVRP